MYWITRAAARAAMWPFFALHREGLENVPRESAFILVPKHQRWVDIPLVGLAAPRPLYYVAKAELFRNPLMGRYLIWLGGIPLNRKRPVESRRHLQTVVSFLRSGEGMVVFPEGTYYKHRMGSGKPGVVRWILNRLDIPFIPVGVRYQGGGARTRVSIHFGRALAGANVPADTFLNRVMGEIARLSGLPPLP